MKGGGNVPRFRRCKHIGCHVMVQYPNYYCPTHINEQVDRRADNHLYNTTTRKRNKDKQDQYKFYRSKEWKSIREAILLRDTYLCQYCKQVGTVNPGNIVDHIVPYEYWTDGKTDQANLVTCCKVCHNVKTKWERAYYGTGLGNDKKEVAKVTDLELLGKLIDSHKKPVERF